MSAVRTPLQELLMISVLTVCLMTALATGDVVLPSLAALFTVWAMWDWRRGIRPWQRVGGGHMPPPNSPGPYVRLDR